LFFHEFFQGTNRDEENEKRELIYKDESQEYAQVFDFCYLYHLLIDFKNVRKWAIRCSMVHIFFFIFFNVSIIFFSLNNTALMGRKDSVR
jgi:hypothetical protein